MRAGLRGPLLTAGPQGASDLGARIDLIESRQAIEDLNTVYAIACDDRDIARLAGCFTSDGEFSSSGGSTSGREALRVQFARRLADFGPTFHVPHRVLVTFDSPDTAHGTVIAHAEHMTHGTVVVAAHRYVDRYERHRGDWLFRSRHVQFMYVVPLDQLATIDPSQPRRRWPGMPPQPADIPESLTTYQAFLRS